MSVAVEHHLWKEGKDKKNKGEEDLACPEDRGHKRLTVEESEEKKEKLFLNKSSNLD